MWTWAQKPDCFCLSVTQHEDSGELPWGSEVSFPLGFPSFFLYSGMLDELKLLIFAAYGVML